MNKLQKPSFKTCLQDYNKLTFKKNRYSAQYLGEKDAWCDECGQVQPKAVRRSRPLRGPHAAQDEGLPALVQLPQVLPSSGRTNIVM